jgi:hypothetical protein
MRVLLLFVAFASWRAVWATQRASDGFRKHGTVFLAFLIFGCENESDHEVKNTMQKPDDDQKVADPR